MFFECLENHFLREYYRYPFRVGWEQLEVFVAKHGHFVQGSDDVHLRRSAITWSPRLGGHVTVRTASYRWTKWPWWPRKLRAALNRLWKGIYNIPTVMTESNNTIYAVTLFEGSIFVSWQLMQDWVRNHVYYLNEIINQNDQLNILAFIFISYHNQIRHNPYSSHELCHRLKFHLCNILRDLPCHTWTDPAHNYLKTKRMKCLEFTIFGIAVICCLVFRIEHSTGFHFIYTILTSVEGKIDPWG